MEAGKEAGGAEVGKVESGRFTASCMSIPEQHSTDRSARPIEPTTMNS